MRAIRIHQTGGPEVLTPEDVADPEPGEGEVVVRVAAAGLNFIDTYQRGGRYPLELPTTPGLEGAGTVEVVGPGVDGVAAGDRVAWTGIPGSYAELVSVPADRLVAVPDHVELDTAAAVMLQGMTAHYLAISTFSLGSEHTALVYAAAGGVGHLLTQIATRRGARVLATASDADKEQLAADAGADAVVRYRDLDIVTVVRELTEGEGVDVVYDSVGADTFAASLDCLRPRGMMVLYGQSSGPVDPVDPQTLNRKGSLYLTRPNIANYIATRAALEWRAGELFEWIAEGGLSVRVDRTWPLGEVAEAHRYIESGQTRGKVLLLP